MQCSQNIGVTRVVLPLLAATAALNAQQPGWTMIGWRSAVQASSFPGSFLEAIDKTAAARVPAIEGHASRLDWKPPETDIAAVRQKLRSSGVSMPTYVVADFPGDEATMRKLFQFAKTLAVETIIGDPPAGQIALVDSLANEYGVNVALHDGNLKTRMQAIDGHSMRIGVCLDTAVETDGWHILKDRVLTLQLHNANAGMNSFLWEVYRSNIKPAAMAIDVKSAPYL